MQKKCITKSVKVRPLNVRNTGPFFDITKRIIDVCLSLIGLVFLTPIMLVAAILIKLTSPGPVFFRQTRLGMLGRPFTILKLRTMKSDYDAETHRDFVQSLVTERVGDVKLGQTRQEPIYKLTSDPRITTVGKFLRKTSLDEAPQLMNVLKGDMSLVGPRPPIPYEVQQYKDWHMSRLACKPGITGLWQVLGRSSTTFDEMVRRDIEYIRTKSIWLDLKIMLKTIRAIITARGAY